MRCNLFSIDIWRFQFPDLAYLSDLCHSDILDNLGLEQLDYIAPGNFRTSARSWERIPGNDRIHDLEPFQPIRDFILEKCLEVWRTLDYYHDQSPKIYQSWVNVTGPHGFAMPHVHYNAALSAVVYLAADPDRGNLIFENPLDLAMCAQPLSRKTERSRHEVAVTTGDVLIFPGWLRHFTAPNRTMQDRISFIANLNGTGESYDPLSGRSNQ